MNKLDKIILIFLGFLIVFLLSFQIHQNKLILDAINNKEIKHEVLKTDDINKTGFFSSVYLKTKNFFK